MDVVERIARGELVVVVDDAPDPQPPVLAAAAATIGPEEMAAMIRHTSGFVSVALPKARCDDLGLPCLAHDAWSTLRAVPAVSVDARRGIGTGISAADRCTTVRVLADPDSVAADLCRPGHVVTVRVPMSAPRGVDARSRLVFAAIDLCGWSQPAPAAVTSVLIGDAGATLNALDAAGFAAAHGLAVVAASAVPAPTQYQDRGSAAS